MTDHANDANCPLLDMAEIEETRSILDQLLESSRLYTKSKDYKELLDHVVKLRPFAPFNAMLLQIQKPGLSYAATATDWWNRFGRKPKEGARPLLILWPFGPVALVFDQLDTEGKDIPQDAFAFPVLGDLSNSAIVQLNGRLEHVCIHVQECDAGDRLAGYIRLAQRATSDKEHAHYVLLMNRNHAPAVRFVTLAHELGHLFLGHLGLDAKLKISDRRGLGHAQQELEAESVAYIVCGRRGVKPKSETYLAGFLAQDTTIGHLDVYQVMRAAGRVESLLGLASSDKRSAGDKPSRSGLFFE